MDSTIQWTLLENGFNNSIGNITAAETLVYDVVSISVYTIISAALAIYILRYFTLKDPLAPSTYFVLFVTYFLNIWCCTLVTIDYAGSLGRGDSAPPEYLIVLWKAVYWSTQLLSWILLPLIQSYVEAGQFTLPRRIVAALIENVVIYALAGGLGGGLLLGLYIYKVSVGESLGFAEIQGLGISLSNAFGLFLLVILLGYGLVELPRTLWHMANKERTLQYMEWKAAELYEAMDDAEEELLEQLTTLKWVDQKVTDGDPLRQYVDRLLATGGEELTSRRFNSADRRASDEEIVINMRFLTKLNKNLKMALTATKRSKYQFDFLQEQAFFLEDVIDSSKSFEKVIKSPFRQPKVGTIGKVVESSEWMYYVKLRAPLLRAAFVGLVIAAAILMWCEVLIPLTEAQNLNVNLSVLYYLLTSMESQRVAVQITGILVIAFIAAVSYFSLFKLKVYKWYSLVPHHSDATSLFFFALFLCRLIPPLCYNFLKMVGHTNGVAFSIVMGDLKLKNLSLIGMIGNVISEWFPLVMVVIAVLTLFNACSRLLSLCKIKRFAFEAAVGEERVKEGREILQRERRRRLNKAAREMTRHGSDNNTLYSSSSVSNHDLRSSYAASKTAAAAAAAIAVSQPQAGNSKFTPNSIINSFERAGGRSHYRTTSDSPVAGTPASDPEEFTDSGSSAGSRNGTSNSTPFGRFLKDPIRSLGIFGKRSDQIELRSNRDKDNDDSV